MSKRTLFLLIYFGVAISSFAQKVTYNYLVDTANIEIKQVQQLFENYIHSRPDSLYNNPYWCEADKHNKSHFDLLAEEFQPSLYMGFPVHVLSINSHHQVYTIKAMFSSCSQDAPPYVLAIVNYVAKKENTLYKLSNYLNESRTKWKQHTSGLITFYYPNYHTFDPLKADQLNNFALGFCKNLNIVPVEFEYYLADDFNELQSLKGIDYSLGMGGEVKPTGRASDGRVFCSGLGESYFHEPVHILLGDHYKCHLWANEGVATYFGGSRGHELAWHLVKVNNYLQSNTIVDLANLLTLQTLDEYTDFRYALGGFIVKRVFDKGGWPLLQQFLNAGTSDKDYYLSIETCLGVKRTDLNTYLRREIKAEVAGNRGTR